MVTIIRGLPGSGKTWYAQHMFKGQLLLEGDQYYTDSDGKYDFGKGLLRSSVDYVKQMLATALAMEIKSIVITATSADGKTAKEYADIARGFGHKVQHFWIDYNNGDTSKNQHGLPDDVIEKMKSTWRPISHEKMIQRHTAQDLFTINHSFTNHREFPEWYLNLHPNQKPS